MCCSWTGKHWTRCNSQSTPLKHPCIYSVVAVKRFPVKPVRRNTWCCLQLKYSPIIPWEISYYFFIKKKTEQKAQGHTKLTSPCRYNNPPPSIMHMILLMATATMHSSEEISSGSLGRYTVLAEPRRSGISDSEYHRYLFLYLSVRLFGCGLCLCVLDGNCVLVWQRQDQGVSWLLELLRPGSQKLMLSLWAAPDTNDNSSSLQMKKSFL